MAALIEPPPAGDGRRSALLHLALFMAPVVALLLWTVVPLARGIETLYLRDVFSTHLEMKQAEAEALAAGRIPLIDPYRAGGQPLAGNPDAVPLYPDNLLYLVAPVLWALNAHFWLHWLAAPFAMFALGRAWGLERRAAWAAGVCYALSGYFLSQLSFYNLVAGVALAPVFVAACLRFAGAPRGGRMGPAAAAAALWALLLLAGDPLLALLAFALAAAAVVARHGRPRASLLPLAAALLCGTLVAAPQLVEFLRILPLSFRGYRGYTEEVATLASFDPRQAAEWLLPQLFGRLDTTGTSSFWGQRFYTDRPPYYPSLYPGLLALALLAAAGRPRGRAAWWGWGVAAGGLFFSLGRFNPVVSWLYSLPGASGLRYPVKLWLPVAVGLSLVCGAGVGRLLGTAGEEEARRGRRALAVSLAALALLFAAAWLALARLPGPAGSWLATLLPAGSGAARATAERLRWAGLAAVSLAVVAALGLAAVLLRRRPGVAVAALLAVHTAAQLALLSPLYPTDLARAWVIPSPALSSISLDARVVHGAFVSLFGSSTLGSGHYPDDGAQWLVRQALWEVYPSAGTLWRRHYELNVSPEGLDSFLSRMARGAVRHSDDAARLRLLAAWGVDRLLLDRPVEAAAEGEVRLLATLPSFGHQLYVYEVEGRTPPVFFAGSVVHAPHLNAAYALLSAPGFDPRATVVLPGEGPEEAGGTGSVRVMAEDAESLEAEVEAASTGVVVVQRAFLPLYRASVDGSEVEPLPANLQHIGIAVPAGRHQVRLWTDRRPLTAASFAAVAGLAGLLLLARRLKGEAT